MIYGNCEKCGKPVDDRYSGPFTPCFPVVGWEELRTQGGANAIKLRERLPNRVRHLECLPSVHDGQMAMV